MRRSVLLAILLASLLGTYTGGAEESTEEGTRGRLTFDQIFDSGSTAPSQVSWGPQGRRLSYVWEAESGKSLHLLDVTTGDSAPVLRIGDSNATGLPGLEELDAYQWSPNGDLLLLESGGDLYRLELGSGELVRMTESEAEEKIPRFSPDGTMVAFVRDWDLWVTDLRTAHLYRLTEGGEENVLLNGITDWVYWEEIWDRTTTGFWWSPDSRRIAYYQFDEREVPSYPMVDFTLGYPEVEWQKYPKAGETNPTVRVGVIDLESRQTQWLATGEEADVYLARIDWLPGSDRVAIQRLNRDQNRLDLLSCEARGGACRTLHTETSSTWVNLTHDLRFLDDGTFLWTSEASGWRKLALHDVDGGQVRQLSPDGWNVTEVNGLSGESSAIYTAHSAGELGALHRAIFRVPIAGGEPQALTTTDSWNRIELAPDGNRFVHWSSRADSPTRIVARAVGGDDAVPLPTAGRPGVEVTSLPERRFLTIPGPEGDVLPAMLMTPADLDPERRHPAIMYHYGGPNSQVVADRWSWRSRSLWHSMMVQRGYVVLMVDNRASNFFGKHGHDRAHRRFGPENLVAQRAGVDFLGSLGYVDVERVGLWGGSGGGYHTLYALLHSPGTWRAGVAFAPVTDFRLYDTIWTERYLDHPDDNPDGYRDSAPTNYAANLSDRLLIVHGTADDNVHPQNTLVMAHKLVEAGKQFEMSIHPRQKHGFRGEDLRHFYERMTEFFDRHLRSTD